MPRRTSRRIVDFFKNGDTSEETDMDNSNNSQQSEEGLVGILKKISNQLESLGSIENKTTQQTSQQTSQQTTQQNNMTENSQQKGNPAEANLQEIYKLLQQNLNQQNSNQENTSQQKMQQQGVKDSKIVQDAAQLLEQAQYELANELEASLKKLKQVISESESLATKISTLIAEEGSKRKS